MPELRRGRYLSRQVDSEADLAAALALRAACFRGGAPDEDGFDSVCRHMLIEDSATSRALCTFRLLPLPGGRAIDGSYAAQHYDLRRLAAYPAPMIELGRFCIRPEAAGNPDILRLAWGTLARVIDAEGAQLLFGCSSFAGTEATRYGDAFGMLRDRHQAPPGWLPRVKATDVIRFAVARLPRIPDPKAALRAMPPLLRSYLAMGGWVSDHAVVDRDLGTLHVFTGLEIAAIPPARARALRAVAG